MIDFLKNYGTTLGPIGVPMSDAQAFALDKELSELPLDDRQLKRMEVSGAPTLKEGERADISWISTEDVDRYGDVVLADGMDDSHYRLNPLVTLGHSFWMPPVGRSVWRKKESRGSVQGILAKTYYPPRPNEWVEPVWQPDEILQLIQSGLLSGKSIGFIGRREEPTNEEMRQYKGIKSIIRKWKLIEYAVCPMGVNAMALLQSVSKSFQPAFAKSLGVTFPANKEQTPEPETEVPFVTLSEVESAVKTELEKVNWQALIEKSQESTLDRLRGRV